MHTGNELRLLRATWSFFLLQLITRRKGAMQCPGHNKCPSTMTFYWEEKGFSVEGNFRLLSFTGEWHILMWLQWWREENSIMLYLLFRSRVENLALYMIPSRFIFYTEVRKCWKSFLWKSIFLFYYALMKEISRSLEWLKSEFFLMNITWLSIKRRHHSQADWNPLFIPCGVSIGGSRSAPLSLLDVGERVPY